MDEKNNQVGAQVGFAGPEIASKEEVTKAKRYQKKLAKLKKR